MNLGGGEAAGKRSDELVPLPAARCPLPLPEPLNNRKPSPSIAIEAAISRAAGPPPGTQDGQRA